MGGWQGHEVPFFVLNKKLNIWIYGPFRHQKNKKSNKQTDKNCQIAVSTTVISNTSSTMVTKYLQFRTSLGRCFTSARMKRAREKEKYKKTSFSCFQRCLQTFYFILPSPLPLALAVNKSPSVFTFITPVRRIIPWVPEVFLACGVNFRCLPKADTSSAVGRSHELDRNRNRARKVSGTQGRRIIKRT